MIVILRKTEEGAMNKIFWIILIILLIAGGLFIYFQSEFIGDNDSLVNENVESISDGPLVDSFYIEDNEDVIFEEVLE